MTRGKEWDAVQLSNGIKKNSKKPDDGGRSPRAEGRGPIIKESFAFLLLQILHFLMNQFLSRLNLP